MDLDSATRKRIRNLCDENKITIYKLEMASGLSPSTLNSYMNGATKNITQRTIQILCDGLGISIRQFYDSELFDDIEPIIK